MVKFTNFPFSEKSNHDVPGEVGKHTETCKDTETWQKHRIDIE
jgi:hypothetical protein